MITRNVPCPRRVNDLLFNEVAEEKEVAGDWIATGVTSKLEIGDGRKGEPAIIDIDMNEEEKLVEAAKSTATKKSQQEEEKKGKATSKPEPEDIDELEEDMNMFEEARKDCRTIRTRTYDISITYDFYYQTPRLWLFGYDESGAPLNKAEMFEDIMSDYANKTVTLETHPHQGINSLSIHPCRHAAVMKKIIDTIEQNGGKADVHQAMFVFLKFISSVVPTIEYDYTRDMELE